MKNSPQTINEYIKQSEEQLEEIKMLQRMVDVQIKMNQAFVRTMLAANLTEVFEKIIEDEYNGHPLFI